MEKETNLFTKVVYFLLLIATGVFAVYSFFQANEFWHPSAILYEILVIAALVMALCYILKKFSKKAAGYYKAFMIMMVCASSISVLIRMVNGCPSYFIAVLYLVALITAVVLATGVNLGWVLTIVAVSALIIARGCLLGRDIMVLSMFGKQGVFILSGAVSNLLLAVTASILVIEKYIDKHERNTD